MPTVAKILEFTWGIAESEARDWLAITPAIKGAVDSQLPGRENGPADAYRHLLWGAELTRRFGPEVARRILETHEIQGDLSSRIGLNSQSPAAAAMDRHNNELSIALGTPARTWEEVEQGAQEIIDRSDRSGNGAGGGAMWLPESEWRSHPVNTETKKEKSAEEWNWPATNWKDGTVDSDPTYRYPYGGEKHRHEPAIDDALPPNPEDAAQMNPLSRPVASWSEDDLRQVMASPAYWQPSHPGRVRAHAMAREWFEQAEARKDVRSDATGRRVPERVRSVASAGGGCDVPAQAHTRKAGKVEVEAHCRTRPAA
jgi:hypothetical protein